MTRRKKTRSLSRIHKVKTGSIKKLKREAGNDRQSGKRVTRKNKSVFEKFLDSNPEAKEQIKSDQQAAGNTKQPIKGDKKAPRNDKDNDHERDNKHDNKHDNEHGREREKDTDLLGQLDNTKRDEDIY